MLLANNAKDAAVLQAMRDHVGNAMFQGLCIMISQIKKKTAPFHVNAAVKRNFETKHKELHGSQEKRKLFASQEAARIKALAPDAQWYVAYLLRACYDAGESEIFIPTLEVFVTEAWKRLLCQPDGTVDAIVKAVPAEPAGGFGPDLIPDPAVSQLINMCLDMCLNAFAPVDDILKQFKTDHQIND